MTNGEFSPTPINPERVSMGQFSLASEKHPDRNEDSSFIDDTAFAMGVFDGVGGNPGSEVASALAAEIVQDYFKEQPPIMPTSLSRLAVKEALEIAHEVISKEPTDILSTAVIAKLFDTPEGEPYVVIAKVGDSRAYLARDGYLDFLTLDRSIP